MIFWEIKKKNFILSFSTFLHVIFTHTCKYFRINITNTSKTVLRSIYPLYVDLFLNILKYIEICNRTGYTCVNVHIYKYCRVFVSISHKYFEISTSKYLAIRCCHISKYSQIYLIFALVWNTQELMYIFTNIDEYL